MKSLSGIDVLTNTLLAGGILLRLGLGKYKAAHMDRIHK